MHGNVEALLQSIDTGKSATIQGMLYPLTGETMDKVKEEYGDFWTPVNNAFKHIGAKETSIPVNREDGQNHALQAFTIPAKDSDTFDPSKPTMVCFHGNGQTMHAMLSQADTYRNMGFNVVLPTMGGYPGSDEGLKTSETTTYQDANAVIEFLNKQGVNEIALHGTSIGGTLAFAAAELHPDVVKFVVADQTLNRAKDVAANLLRNNIGSLVPTCMVRGIVGSAFAPGQAVPGVKTADGKPYKTDGLDSNRKAAQLREREEQGKGSCEVYAIKSSHDFFMGRAGDKEKGFNENFADDLAAARYGTNQGHTVQIKGGHCTWFNKNDNDLHVQQLKNQLTTYQFNN